MASTIHMLKKGVNYVDVCDDYDTTELLLDKFNKSALGANITCIVGLGASPGLTNLIAAYGSKQFTSVEEIKIFVMFNFLENCKSWKVSIKVKLQL